MKRVIVDSDNFKKAVKVIPDTNIQLQEFMALLAGIRPAIRHTAKPMDLDKIKENFPELFCYLSNDYFGNKTNACILAKDKKTLDIMIDNVFSKDHTHFKQVLEGELLGYPDCCIKHHTKYVENKKIHDLDASIYDCFKNSKKCSPYINNLLSFSTRIRTEEDLEKRKQFDSLYSDRLLPNYSLTFISHMPCRFDCKKSIEIGKRVGVLLKKYCPKIEKSLISILSKPILYFSVFDLYIFDGYVRGQVLYYKKILPPYFPVDPLLLEKINEGNMIWANEKQIVVMKDNKTLYRYVKKREEDGFIVDFGE